jgi:hypothetical protein
MRVKSTSCLLALSILILVGCGRKTQDDALIQRQLAGTWIGDGGVVITTNTIDVDGRYSSVVVQSNVVVARLEGTLKVRDGFMINTITNHSQTNLELPIICRATMIRLSNSELVLKWPWEQSESPLRKISR